MLAMKCPSCAAPVPLSLASPDHIRCAFCGHQGAPPSDVRARLGTAAEVVSAHQTSERQLRGNARLLVSYGQILRALHIGLTAVTFGPLAAVVLMSIVNWLGSKRHDPMPGLLVLASIPMVVIVVGAALVSLRLLKSATRRAEAAAAAVPPERDGEPARCHVCCAPLEGNGVRGIARCAHCAADNIVSASVLTGASARRLDVLDDYVAEVRKESVSVARAFGGGTLLFVGAVVLTPYVCVVPTAVAGMLFWAMGGVAKIIGAQFRDPTPGNRYALVETAAEGRCIAWYNRYTQRWERRTKARHPGGEGGGDAVPEPVHEVALTDLVGRHMRVAAADDPHRGFAGEARSPRASIYIGADGELLDGSDSVYLGGAGPKRPSPVRVELWKACLVDEDRLRTAPGR
jgi:hypothetical protein